MRARVAFLVVAVIVAASTAPSTAADTSVECLSPPVAAPVVDGFRNPGCPWCAGNRGWEFGIGTGALVKAAAGGWVSFAGPVAGTLYVVVAHRSGLRTTYGRLGSLAVSAGATVRAGQPVGTTGGGLFFGVRRGGTYLDPARFVWRLIQRARLVPADGSPARPGGRPRWSCTAREQGR